MANVLYGLGREAFLAGDIAWDTDDIRCILIDAADYTVNIDVDQFLSDIPAGARVATSGALTTKTVALGVADAADVVLGSVSGDESENIVVYQHTGVEGTSRLIGFVDTATGLPVTPNGGDITIQWDNGADKIFKL